jgi:hypothetical protein
MEDLRPCVVPGPINGRVAQSVVEELNPLKHKWRGRIKEMAYQQLEHLISASSGSKKLKAKKH